VGWAVGEVHVLREEIERGGSDWRRRVARRTGRTPVAVSQKANEMGVTVHRVKSFQSSQERGRLRPGLASVAKANRKRQED
jgi:hypothetical protein